LATTDNLIDPGIVECDLTAGRRMRPPSSVHRVVNTNYDTDYSVDFFAANCC